MKFHSIVKKSAPPSTKEEAKNYTKELEELWKYKAQSDKKLKELQQFKDKVEAELKVSSEKPVKSSSIFSPIEGAPKIKISNLDRRTEEMLKNKIPLRPLESDF